MKNLIYIACYFFTLLSFAQEEPSFSLYKYNMHVINPAYAGSTEFTNISLNVRKQWLGLDGAPTTNSFYIDSPFSDRIGVGLSIINDQYSIIKETQFYADFSYKLDFGFDEALYLGIKAGGAMLNIDYESLSLSSDPLFANNLTKFNPNIGIGAYYKSENFWAQLAVPRILTSTWVESESTAPVVGKSTRHYYVGGGTKYFVGSYMTANTAVMAKMAKGVPTSVDISGSLIYDEKFEAGLSYRFKESLGAMVSVKPTDWLFIAYAYEYNTTAIKEFNSGTHEVLVRFSFERNIGAAVKKVPKKPKEEVVDQPKENFTEVKYYIANRTKEYAPDPKYTCINGGFVAVDIVVSEHGQVIKVAINNTKTTATDQCLKDAALQYAKATIFGTSQGAPNVKGIITYNFIKE